MRSRFSHKKPGLPEAGLIAPAFGRPGGVHRALYIT